MQTANQIFFALLSFILIGLFVSTITPSGFKKDGHLIYWQASILLRASAFISWMAAPYLIGFFLTIANFCFLASMTLMVLLFRSWRIPLKRFDLIFAAVFVLSFMSIFEVLRQFNASFVVRSAFMAIPIIIISIWEMRELTSVLKTDRSLGLKTLMIMVLISLIVTFSVGIGGLVNKSLSNAAQLINFDGTFMLWGSLSMHLLIYISVSSYLYQRMMTRERDALLSLDRASVENAQIKALLDEREGLISSLLIANKTAATGALSASIAHELNQPVTAIGLNTEFIKRRLSEGSLDAKEINEVIAGIQFDNQRIATIVATLREIFRQDDVKTSLVNLDDVIQQMQSIILPQAKKSQIDLRFDLQSHQMTPLNTNEISQVILNLLNNAIDALSSHQLNNKIINIKTCMAGDFVELYISDNGPGISLENRSSIFNLMKSNKKEGMGLGLWLCKHIVNRHQGQILYQESQLGGAEFVVRLPINPELIKD
jgi:C4-dicarboxylate-specific signal transduction histidine kinase